MTDEQKFPPILYINGKMPIYKNVSWVYDGDMREEGYKEYPLNWCNYGYPPDEGSWNLVAVIQEDGSIIAKHYMKHLNGVNLTREGTDEC